MKKIMGICIGFVLVMCLSFIIPLQATEKISLQCLQDVPMYTFTFCEQRYLNCRDDHTAYHHYSYNNCIEETQDFSHHYKEGYNRHQRHH